MESRRQGDEVGGNCSPPGDIRETAAGVVRNGPDMVTVCRQNHRVCWWLVFVAYKVVIIQALYMKYL